MSPQSPSGAEVVPVSQADREAAAEVFPTWAASILTGKMDATHNVQAFARHRLAEQERCAKVAEECVINLPGVGYGLADGASLAATQIATTIRSTTHDK